MSIELELLMLKSDLGTIRQCIEFLNAVKAHRAPWVEQNFELVLTGYMAARKVARQYAVEIVPINAGGLDKLEITEELLQSIEPLGALLNRIVRKLDIVDTELRIKRVFETQTEEIDEDSNFLVLRPGTRDFVTDLISKLRLEITNADWVEDPQRLRTLKKISNVETEILQPMSSYERVLGGLMALGDTIGEMGTRSKPAVDRVVEIIISIKGEKRETAQISKDKEPLQIPDMRTSETML